MKQPLRNKICVEIRRLQAQERLEKRKLLTPAQRLAVLDARLGVGVGAKKERARLTKLIQNPAPVAVPAPATTPVVKAAKKGKRSGATAQGQQAP